MQFEITEAIPLLDAQGNLTKAGYAKRLLPVYRRADVRVKGMRIKEWDYYLVMNDRFALALTVADNDYMGLDSISLLDFETGEQITQSPMQILTRGKKKLPETSAEGDIASSGKGYGIFYKNDGKKRTLIAHMEKFGPCGPMSAKVELTEEPEESIVICTPFEKSGHFYYNQKINCMRAKGEVTYNGKTYVFDPADSFGTLDWGRGVWTYKNTWYWGSGSGLVDGVPFGFNIGYGFGDTSAASENMLFYDGKAHKLDQVLFHIPRKDGKDDFLAPWRFASSDGRFEMDFVPVMDRASKTDVGIICSDQHQVFGRFTGKAILDDGREILLKDFMGFAEKVRNKW